MSSLRGKRSRSSELFHIVAARKLGREKKKMEDVLQLFGLSPIFSRPAHKMRQNERVRTGTLATQAKTRVVNYSAFLLYGWCL